MTYARRPGRYRQLCRSLQGGGHRGHYEVVDLARGSLVWTLAEDGQKRPARVVIGPHWQGEFEVVIVCNPEHWEAVEAETRPPDDYWGEACFAWPVEAIEGSN